MNGIFFGGDYGNFKLRGGKGGGDIEVVNYILI
jgi:hypothetical protein